MTAAQKQAQMIADITASVLAAMSAPAVTEAAPAKTTRKRKATVKAAPVVVSCFKVRGGSKLDESKCEYLTLDETLDTVRAQYAAGQRYARYIK